MFTDTERIVISLLLGALVTLVAIALLLEVGKVVRRGVRRRALRRELASTPLPPLPPLRAVSDRRRSGVGGVEVQPLRPGESRDPPAAKVLAFTERLHRRGRYIDELQIDLRIDRRLN
jgi:hypothetical protein